MQRLFSRWPSLVAPEVRTLRLLAEKVWRSLTIQISFQNLIVLIRSFLQVRCRFSRLQLLSDQAQETKLSYVQRSQLQLESSPFSESLSLFLQQTLCVKFTNPFLLQLFNHYLIECRLNLKSLLIAHSLGVYFQATVTKWCSSHNRFE